ncbi:MULTISPECIES: FtsX-like permease family protein [unclassified Streptomyces]|uniref:ABC transporter permease n=1 Tax=unclassified Streptomyces TaxID=2593676 RepID=UPI000DC7DD86|nr:MULTISPECIES: FtsX-like permease family protein [unclassified Streptomyces]AWZ04253.1 ABC transporter [Streptomyces sp. ICC4]AWZ14092.1 ABC transporter [Streptomyces sp. ICC1]
MLRTALRNVFAYKARLLTTAFAVMLGVTFITGSLVYGDSHQQAAVDRAVAGYDRISLDVAPDTVPGRPPATLDARTAAVLAEVPGVAAVAGRVSGFAAVPDREGRLLGDGASRRGGNFAPGKDGGDPAYRFTEGSGPTGEHSVALDEDSAAEGGYRVGDTVRVAANTGAASYTLSGVFRTDASKRPAGGSLTLFGDAAAQKLFLAPGAYTNIEITAAPGTDAGRLLGAVEKVLPEGTSAVTGAQLARLQANLASSDSDTMSQIMVGFAAVALFVSAFLISNTFTMLVSRRTRELALMRAVGATRRQVRRGLLAESALVGLIASVAGIAAGTGVAALLQALFAAAGAPEAPLVLLPSTVLIALAAGTALPVIAAWLPIRRAMAIPPVAALGAAEPAEPARTGSPRTAAGAALVLCGTAAVLYGALPAGQDAMDARTVIGLGAALTLVGATVLIPLLSRPFVALLRPLLTRLSPVHGDLAARNTVRDPRRTGATAAALAIALALASGLSVLGASATRYLDGATTRDLAADYLVKGASGGQRMTPATAEPLKGLPGAAYSPLNQSTQYRIGGVPSVLTGVDPATIGRLLRYDVVEGSLDGLAEGRVAVADFKARANGWKVGQTLPVERLDQHGTVTIGAVYHADEQSNLLPSITAPDSLVARYDSAPTTDSIVVDVPGGPGRAGLASIVKALGDNPALSVLDEDAIRAEDTSGIGDQLNVFHALLSMALVIAALGIANTLALSVLERGKEIGTLRAIGMERAGVSRMIRTEALLVGALGAVVGTVMGVFTGWALGRTLAESVAGYALVVPWGRLALGVLLALAGALLASLWPARRAARVDIPAATAAQ